MTEKASTARRAVNSGYMALQQKRVVESRIFKKKECLLPSSRSASTRAISSVYTIDYSPKSCFLKELRSSGEVMKVPQKKKKSPLVERKNISPAKKTPPFKRQCLKKSPLEPTGNFFHPKPCPGFHTLDKSEIVPRLQEDGHVTLNTAAIPLTPNGRLRQLQDFRKKNWTECHSSTTALRQQAAAHTCKHEYKLDSRLMPQPLVHSQSGCSVCNICLLPSSEAVTSQHFLITDEDRREIPDPALYKPKLRPLKHRKIAEAPTLSYIPHFRQRIGKLLKP